MIKNLKSYICLTALLSTFAGFSALSEEPQVINTEDKTTNGAILEEDKTTNGAILEEDDPQSAEAMTASTQSKKQKKVPGKKVKKKKGKKGTGTKKKKEKGAKKKKAGSTK